MKNIIIIFLSLGVFGCSSFSSKRPPEVVPSCFSDGENQARFCKSQRTNEEGKVVITRCIGSQNREANPLLRGKCVEKICSPGSNTDCQVKGEFAVLEQYAELVTSNQFASDDASTEVDTDPSVALKKLPTPAHEKGVATKASAKKVLPKEVGPDTSSMTIALKPIKAKKKSRSIASVGESNEGFKRVCVSKGDMEAPANLRGKCATRNCIAGKCTYKGRKEMFDFTGGR